VRPVLLLVAGTPGRAATSAVAATTCGYLLAGYGRELLVGAAVVASFALITLSLWFLLAAAGAVAGIHGTPEKEKADV
jgi:hypothetical protein